MRQRRNRVPGGARLPAEGTLIEVKVPAPRLPPGEWHPQTLAWWDDIWKSPMRGEFLKADVHGLFILAELVDQFWEEPGSQLAAEIRLQRQCFGLTPIDRRRLQWEVERGEAAEERLGARRAGRRRRTREDPRRYLRAVK
jgi:hypothetical protein